MKRKPYNSKRRRVLPDGTIEKFCSRCSRWKPLGALERDKKAPDGFAPRCRSCWNVVRKIQANMRRPPGLSIGEVAARAGVATTALYHWENEFRAWLRPTRSVGGTRYYSEQEAQVVVEIARLLRVELYTCAGARRQLDLAKAERERKAG
jgi:hypothetical protein